MTENIPWDLYRTFLAVLSEGSLSAAARALGLTQPTVGRQISELEQSLGVDLFTRSQTGLLPTDAGLALQADVQAMSSIAAALARTAKGFGDGVSGAVRISASEVVAVEVLPPLLAKLQAEYPRLEIELVLSNKIQDLVRREADIAVRMTSPKQEVLMATRVGEICLGMYAHRDYLERRGYPQSPSELTQHALIGFDQETPFLRQALTRYTDWKREAFALRCDSDLAQLALLRAGAGIGICQVGLACRNSQLVRVLPTQFELPLTTWVTMHEGLRHSPRYLTTFRSLVEGLKDYTQNSMSEPGED